MNQYAQKLDLLRGVGLFLMGRVVNLPQAIPLRLCLCLPGGRGWGCRSVMEVDCGTRKSSVLGVVAPVTGPRRAVTHCDRACTNAQRPNTPQVLRYPGRCSLSATTAAALSSSPSPVRADYAPQPTHAPPTDPREPSSLHQPAPQMLLRALPAPPTQLRLLHGSLIFDFEICPIKSLNPSTSHKKDDCSPSLLPCTSSLRSATTFRLYASPPLHLLFHLISSLSTTLCTLSSPLLDELYCEMCKKQDLRTDLS